jgi:hypothetical protein
VGHLAIRQLGVALGVGVFAGNLEGTFVVPPGDVAPIGFVIFKELTIELQILTESDQNLGCTNTFLGRDTLVPLGLPEMECSDTVRDIKNGTLFCTSILKLDTSKLSVFISRHEVNTTLL